MSAERSQDAFRTMSGLLIVDEDRWVHQLPYSSYFGGRTVERNLCDGLGRMDRRHHWEAGIFSNTLTEGELPFGNGELGMNAGYVLALAFFLHFPGKRVAIVSGYGEWELRQRKIGTLLNPELCRVFPRARATGSYWDYTAYEEHQKMLDFLSGSPGVRFREEWLEGLLAEKVGGMERTLGELVEAALGSGGGEAG